MITITEPEYALMKQYIEQHCGIHLEKGKEYLIETRLSDLVIETGCGSFQEFHLKARTDMSGKLRDRIVDEMTTNETLWFRDSSAWDYLRDTAVPDILNKAAKNQKVRIWSSAASTGQEAYSLLMLLNEQAKARANLSSLSNIEILATDISPSALYIAISARYDSFSINRGLPGDLKTKYFAQEGNIWVFNQELKKLVSFKKFNLQDSFLSLGVFDLILCRYVSIYFSEEFKKDVFSKMAKALHPGGVLLLGVTESLRGFADAFEIAYSNKALVNIRK